MEYPREIVLEDKKILKLLKEKDETLKYGRKYYDEAELLEAKLLDIDKEMQDLENAVDIADLKDEAVGLTNEFNAVKEKMDNLNQRVVDRKKVAVPQELKDKYDATKAEKEKFENLRNKAALKIQKINDKTIPLVRRLMRPFLQGIYEDYDSARLEGDTVVATVFSHLDDFEKNFANRKK